MADEKLIAVNHAEEKVLKIIRETKWGEITVKIKDKKPVMICKIREDISLTG